jgi:hypothetical protein
MLKKAGKNNSNILILVIPLLLSSITHLWNLTGFPPIYMDEDIYMRKALKSLNGLPLEPDRTNSVYGWLILSIALGAVGFPNSLDVSPNGGAHSIEILYLVPRALIGILGILDTFLIYKILERYYNNRNVALTGSILFAVMPMTWLTRYVLLETIQLPFLLSSILFAVYTTKSKNSTTHDIFSKLPPILLSGIFLGLAIFIKFPTFAMIPFIGFLIYKNVIYRDNKSVKILGLWFIPVILIPLLSPIYANSSGMLNIWWDGIVYNVHRGKQPLLDLTGQMSNNAINIIFRIDPLLISLGAMGLIFAAIRRDLFLLLWTIPYIILYYALGYVAFYHFIPIFPAFCIAAAKLILDLLDKIKDRNNIKQILLISIVSGIGIFGFASTVMLITTNTTSTHFEAAAFMAKHIPDTKSSKANEKSLTLIMGESRFYWVLKYAFHKVFNYTTYWTYESANNETGKVVMVVEPGAFNYWKKTEVDKERLNELLKTYNKLQIVLVLNRSLDSYIHNGYPYTSMTIQNLDIGRVEIRTNREGAVLFQDLKLNS